MVFQTPYNTISKHSKTTYAQCCDKHEIPWTTFTDIPVGVADVERICMRHEPCEECGSSDAKSPSTQTDRAFCFACQTYFHSNDNQPGLLRPTMSDRASTPRTRCLAFGSEEYLNRTCERHKLYADGTNLYDSTTTLSDGTLLGSKESEMETRTSTHEGQSDGSFFGASIWPLLHGKTSRHHRR